MALVTGASSGIGRAVAVLLAAEGATVGVNSIDPEGTRQVVDEIRAARRQAVAVVADVTDPVGDRGGRGGAGRSSAVGWTSW